MKVGITVEPLSLVIFFTSITRLWSLQIFNIYGKALPKVLQTSFGGLSSSTSVEEYLIASFDGVIAKTYESNACLAIETALETWPHLKKDLNFNPEDVYNPDDGRCSWLVNKMVALSHVTNCHESDSVLLARLILEEQLLDEGRSVGKTGKYSSKFHPSSSIHEESYEKERSQKSSRGARPLTVGEISSNWRDGAMLVESLLTRYNIGGSDPLPIIKDNLRQKRNDQLSSRPPPTINPTVANTLSLGRDNVFVTLSHASQVSSAVAAFSSINLKVEVAKNIENLLNHVQTKSNAVLIIPPFSENETEQDTIEQILTNVSQDEKSSFLIVHNTIKMLNNLYSFILFSGKEIKNAKTTLLFPTWPDDCSLESKFDADLDPWLNVIDENEFSELISAKTF